MGFYSLYFLILPFFWFFVFGCGVPLSQWGWSFIFSGDSDFRAASLPTLRAVRWLVGFAVIVGENDDRAAWLDVFVTSLCQVRDGS